MDRARLALLVAHNRTVLERREVALDRAYRFHSDLAEVHDLREQVEVARECLEASEQALRDCDVALGEPLGPEAQARASYLLADEAETRLRIRDAIARRDAGERVQYLVEAEGIGLIGVRQDLRRLGIDTSKLER